jgi:hypothetical protein
MFGVHRAMKDGIALWCKPCTRAHAIRYRNENIDLVRAKDRARSAAASLESKRAKHAEWRKANLDHIRAYAREIARKLYAANPQKYRDRARRYYQSNTEKCLAASAAYKTANRERIAICLVAYRATNAKKIGARMALWREANIDKVRADGRRRKKVRVDTIADGYVRQILSNDDSALARIIPASLVALKAEHLKLKRLIKDIVHGKC